MNYFVNEYQVMEYAQRTAGIKARDDVSSIYRSKGLGEISIPLKKERDHTALGLCLLAKDQVTATYYWNKAFQNLEQGDKVYIQFPLVSHSIFIGSVFHRLKRKGIKIVLLIHDLESFRMQFKQDTNILVRKGFEFEENGALKWADEIIFHNKKMASAALKMGIARDKIKILRIFDYLIPDYDAEKMSTRVIDRKEPVIIAGNLRKHKAGYIYNLPNNCNFNLYGVGYEDQKKENIHYYGSFESDDLPYHLNGSFGLVWDGESSETCEGLYGSYLKINNPHKTSLYLASGIPVVIWSKAALADFIQTNKCGITIDSISDIATKIESLSNEEYLEIRRNVEKIGKLLRNGYFTLSASGLINR